MAAEIRGEIAAFGLAVQVIAALQRVKVLCEGRLVADHGGVSAACQTPTDHHLTSSRALRRHRVGTLCPAREADVESRTLRLRATLGIDLAAESGFAS